MYQMLLEFANWLQNLPWVLSMGGSIWSFPFIQALHFTGLSLWVGTNIALDLHLLTIGKRTQTAAEFADALFVWNWIGFAAVVTGGSLMFSINAVNYVENPAFETKLGLLIPTALILHIFIQQKVKVWGRTMEVPTAGKVAGGVEALLWLCVALAAVVIPYF
jgi:hypothetical protein